MDKVSQLTLIRVSNRLRPPWAEPSTYRLVPMSQSQDMPCIVSDFVAQFIIVNQKAAHCGRWELR